MNSTLKSVKQELCLSPIYSEFFFFNLQKIFILTDYIHLSITNYLFASIKIVISNSTMLHSYDNDLLVLFSPWTNFNIQMQSLTGALTKHRN